MNTIKKKELFGENCNQYSFLWERTLNKYCEIEQTIEETEKSRHYNAPSFWDLKFLLCDKDSRYATNRDGHKANLPLTEREFAAFCGLVAEWNGERDAIVIENAQKALSLLLGAELEFHKGDFEIRLAAPNGFLTFVRFDDSDLESFATYSFLSKYIIGATPAE